MAYGSNMKRLSPCTDEESLGLLAERGVMPGRLLDAGCGRGRRLAALAERWPTAALWGLDCDEENLTLAAQACPGASLCPGDLAALPWDGDSFDAALCECTLSLTEVPERALAELHRVLRPGGTLLLADLCRDEGATVSLPAGGTVRRIFSAAELERMAAAAGFRCLRVLERREALLTLAAEMILDGSFCDCMGPGGAAALKRYRPGYRVWVLEKEAPKTKLCAVVAAAGLSSRMGEYKPLLPFDGTTVIGRCVDNLHQAGAETVIVVTGHRAPELEAALADRGVRFVRNPDYASTQMFDSLRLGLAALPPECSRVLLTPGDVPWVSPELIRTVAETPGAFVCPGFGGRRGHPIALDAACVPALLAAPDTDGLRGALAALGLQPVLVDTGEIGTTMDLDTPEDYRRLLALQKTEE